MVLSTHGYFNRNLGLAAMLIILIIILAVAVIAALAARSGQPYLYGLSFTFAAYVLRPCAPTTMAGRGAAAVGTVLAGYHRGPAGGVRAIPRRAREMAQLRLHKSEGARP